MHQLFMLENHFIKGLMIIVRQKNMLFEFGKKHYNAYKVNKMRKAYFDKSKQVLITFMK